MKQLLAAALLVSLLAAFGCSSEDSAETEYTPDNTSTQFEAGESVGADTTGGHSAPETDQPISDQ